jgi:hypothetical protein
MTINKLLNFLIAAVWLVNGLFCKVLNYVPRHREIVAGILGSEHALLFTKAIGFAEIAMAIWIVSGFLAKLNTITQVLIIATMNIIEFILAPGLLLNAPALPLSRKRNARHSCLYLSVTPNYYGNSFQNHWLLIHCLSV